MRQPTRGGRRAPFRASASVRSSGWRADRAAISARNPHRLSVEELACDCPGQANLEGAPAPEARAVGGRGGAGESEQQTDAEESRHAPILGRSPACFTLTGNIKRGWPERIDDVHVGQPAAQTLETYVTGVSLHAVYPLAGR